MSPVWPRSYSFEPPLLITIVLRLHRLMIENMRRRLRPLGLHPGQDRLLLAIQRRGMAEYVQELVDQHDYSKQTIQRALRRAEAAGLIELRPSPWDRRCRNPSLTSRGQELIEPVKRVWEAVEADLRNGMTNGGDEATMEEICKAMDGLGPIDRPYPTIRDLPMEPIDPDIWR